MKIIWVNLLGPLYKLKFFNHRAKRGGSLFEGGSGREEGSRSDPNIAGRFASVRQFFAQKLLLMLTEFHETWQDWSLGQARQLELSTFANGNQGAKL